MLRREWSGRYSGGRCGHELWRHCRLFECPSWTWVCRPAMGHALSPRDLLKESLGRNQRVGHGRPGWPITAPAAQTNGKAAGAVAPVWRARRRCRLQGVSGACFLEQPGGYPGPVVPQQKVCDQDGRPGVTPERAPILAFMGSASGRRDYNEQAMGWLAQERNSRGGPGPRAMAKHLLRSIQGWRLPTLQLCRGSQVFRRRYGRRPQPSNCRRCANGRRPRAFRPTDRPRSR